eukprot:TRINITY_DN12424_c0_g1_i4.p1 TRINITY_DN12424_c0_g1~~TRINITY_DN12424_c0_g1_i4.p1  ORF type:complete len:434 (+),score=60.97 TRINITY_DN12424_c0_g1_i4:84-1385(+)
MLTCITVACLGTAVLAEARHGEEPLECQDLTLPSGSAWYDVDGPRYNCGWYAEGPRCSAYGYDFRNVYTANESCCVCGGGLGANETYAPPTAAPPTPSPPTFPPYDPQCEDRLLPGGEEWHLMWGPQYNCSWFELEPRHCERYGWRSNVYTAIEACCVCGGGLASNETNVPATAAPPTPSPPTFPPYDPQCEDRLLPGGEEWHLIWGPQYNCSWFESSPRRCQDWYVSSAAVYTANEACCVCGGGLGANETYAPPTAAPPTPSPPTFPPYDPQCEDRLLPGGEEWHLTWGPQYNCSWFESSPRRCQDWYVSSAAVYTATEACCVCGGGLASNETNVPATAAPPTPSPPTFPPYDPQCEDRLLPGGEEWHLTWGPQYNCSWFELKSQHCERYGYSNVYTATEACCVCGGGLASNETNVPATAAPPTPSPPTFAP